MLAQAMFRREVRMMPGKPVAARGKRFSPAELEAARRVRLADVIADDLGGAVLRRQPRAVLRRGPRAVRDAGRSLVAGAV